MSVAGQVQFSEQEQRLRYGRTKVALLLGAVMMPGGAILDWVSYPEKFWPLLILRAATSVILVLGFLFVKQRPVTASIGNLSMGLLLVPAFAMASMIYLTDGAASLYYLGLILLMVFLQLIGFTTAEAATFCGCCLAAYVIAIYLNESAIENKGQLSTSGIFFLGTIGLVSVAICSMNRSYRLNDFQLRRELGETNQQLKLVNQQRAEFLANVSHELRTPLAMILAPLDEVLSTRGSVSEPMGQTLSIVRRNADRLRFLVDDLLDVVRIETSQFRLQLESMDGRELIQEIVRSAQSLASARNVLIKFNSTANRADLNIDVARVERVFLNLITNAIKFSPANSIVEIRLDVEQGFAVFRCRDSGPGIPLEFRERVFERHFQIPFSGQRLSPGLGLGLAIAKDIVLAHRGSIECRHDDQALLGCEFVVKLPLVAAPNELPIKAAMDQESIHVAASNSLPDKPSMLLNLVPKKSDFIAASDQQLPLIGYVSQPSVSGFSVAEESTGYSVNDAKPVSGCDVLVIDDEHDIRQFLQNSLRQRYETLTAETAVSGVELAIRARPRCILLDMMLPDHDGLWVLRELKKSELLADAKILMLTAQSDESLKLRAMEQGVDDFLAKPFSIAELHARVAGLVRASRLQQDLRKEKQELELSIIQLKSTEAQLFESEKMRAVGSMAAGLLHEINNPVNYTLMAITLLQRDTANGKPTEETLRDVKEGVTRIGEIVSDLRSFAYPDQANQTNWFRLDDAIRSTLRFAAADLKETPVTVVLSSEQDVWIEASRSQITQVILNLLQNAAKSTKAVVPPRSPTIELCVQLSDERASVQIKDNGSGMNEATMARITEPFFTTAEPGEGIGLGLSICDTILRAHGARLHFTSVLGVGTTVTFNLPFKSRPES